MIYRISAVISIAIAALSFLFAAGVSAESIKSSPVLISEIQTYGLNPDGTENSKYEFVELYNNSSVEVDLSGWQIDFLTQKHDGVSAPTRIVANLNLSVAPYSFMLASHEGYLPDADLYFTGGPASGFLPKGHGTVRLLDPEGGIRDMVGYGSPNNYLVQLAKAPSPGKSLQRCFDGDLLANTQNNAEDFAVYDQPTPRDGYDCPLYLPDNILTGTDNACEGVIISELLPNPAGSDAGREFIELFNTAAQPLNLKGCALTTTANSKLYIFPDLTLQPGEYKAFYDSQTALVLPNAAGGTVYLLSGNNEELHAVTYPPGPADDLSWVWFGGNTYKATYVLTPNAPNLLEALKPCGAGEERNAETNRCRTVSLSGALAPCAAGQERNPLTNRCRLIVSSAGLSPCPEGQERNPETNRCRKITGETLTAGVQDVISVPDQGAKWQIIVAIVLLAAGYGIWEWRHEVISGLISAKQKLARHKNQ